jgi:hypothetical protein
MARYATLRASDADRDVVADRLRAAAVEGRLEHDELEERLHLALRARTYGDLQRLMADLPAGQVRRRVPATRTAFGVALRLAAMLAILAVVLVGIALSAAWLIIWAVVWLAFRGHACARVGRPARPVRPRFE